MKAIEAANPELRDVLPQGYQRIAKSTLSELLRLFAPSRQLSGDAFGLIYEDFLSNFAASEAAWAVSSSRPTPSCGSSRLSSRSRAGLRPSLRVGSVFVQCAKFVKRHSSSPAHKLSVYGNEHKEGTLPLAKMKTSLCMACQATSAWRTATTRTPMTRSASSTSSWPIRRSTSTRSTRTSWPGIDGSHLAFPNPTTRIISGSSSSMPPQRQRATGFVMANSAADAQLLERELEFLANVVRIEARRSRTTEGSEALLKSDSRTTLMSTYRVSARWSPAPRLRLRVGA